MFQQSRRQVLKEGNQFSKDEYDTLAPVDKEQVDKAMRWEGQGFDIRVHVIEPRSGMLLRYQPYRRQVEQGEVTYYRKDEHGVERAYTEQGLPKTAQSMASMGAPKPRSPEPKAPVEPEAKDEKHGGHSKK